VIIGILTIVGLGKLLSGIPIPLLIPDPNLRNDALIFIPWATGGKIILDGLIYKTAGEFLVLFDYLAEYINKNIGEIRSSLIARSFFQ